MRFIRGTIIAIWKLYCLSLNIVITCNFFMACIFFLSITRKCEFFFFNFIYLFMAVLGLRFCARAFLQLWQAGATLHRGARASHYRGLSCCGAQAPDAQAQRLWLTGVVAPRHVGSSQTRARTRVPCIGRQILNHCTTREALENVNFNIG